MVDWLLPAPDFHTFHLPRISSLPSSQPMLSSLPPELLLQIIESSIPHTFHSTTYRDRQDTLLSLSLVSKYFCAIAQPLLFEIVWIKSLGALKRYKRTVSSFRGGDRGVGKVWRPKTAVIGSRPWDAFTRTPEKAISKAILKEVAQLFSSVKSLIWALNSITVVSFPYLTSFSDLSTLHLSTIVKTGKVSNLPKLRSLTMWRVDSSLMDPLLDPAVVPNLRHFALVNCSAQAANDLVASQFARLVPQLQTLSFDMKLWRRFDSKLRDQLKTRTLIDCHHIDFGCAAQEEMQAVNVRMHSPAEDGEVSGRASYLKTSLENFATSVDQNPTLPLESLYLDSSLRLPSALSPDVVQSITKVVKICQKRQIDIVFETAPDDFSIDPCISPEFVKRQVDPLKKVASQISRLLI
ncbi:hypothetical protein JCM3765_005448 [Sporobolomyces pararoseus]